MTLEIIENECPYCHAHLFMNKKSFANHIRWCKSNPKYEEIRNSTISKLKEKTLTQVYKCNCAICGGEYEINVTAHIYELGKFKRTCSDKCSKQLTAFNTNQKEKANKISKKLKQEKTNIHNCICCGKEIYNTRSKFCSNNCKLNYKLKNRTQKGIYKYFCNFTFSLNEFPDEFDFDLIRQYGWYKPTNHGNNLFGISRDHKYSCDEGFNNFVDPYLISHPANCVLMKHTENQSKRNKCSITLDELINNVIEWNKKYGKYPNKINYEILKINNVWAHSSVW